MGIEVRESNKFEPSSIVEPLHVTCIQWQALRQYDKLPKLINISSYAEELKKHAIACKAATLVANNHVTNLGDKDSDKDFCSDDDYFMIKIIKLDYIWRKILLDFWSVLLTMFFS